MKASRLVANLPNAITVVRLLLVPVWGILAEASRQAFDATGSSEPWRLRAVAVLALIGVSDVFDGYLARRLGVISRTGATLDAVADKAAQVVLLTFFAFRGPPAYAAIPLWFLLLVFGRDLVLLLGCLLVRRRAGSVEVVHRAHGKLASVLLFLLLVWINLGGSADLLRFVLPAFGAVVAISTAAYVRDGWQQVKPRV